VLEEEPASAGALRRHALGRRRRVWLAFTRAFSHLQLDADIRAAIEREIAQRVPRLSEDKWRSLTG
jgi:hypothetical protein